MFPHRHDRVRFLDEELFHNLSSFPELEARILGLEDPQRQKKAFAIFAEGYLALRTMPRTVEILPSARLTEIHYQRLSIPKTMDSADGFLFLAESGCHPYSLLFHGGDAVPSPETCEPFDRLLKHSHCPLLFTNLRQLPEHWLKADGFQHITGVQLDRLSVTWFSQFLRWLQSGINSRRPTLPSIFLTETIQRLRNTPPGTTTLVMPDGPEQDELLFHLAASPGQKRLTLVLTPGAGRMMDLLEQWRDLPPPVPLSLIWVTSGKEMDKSENVLPGEMDFPRIQDTVGIRRFLTSRDGNPRILCATYAAIPMIQQAQLGLPPIELTLLPDSHALAQQPKLFDALLANGLPPSRLRFFLTSTPCRTNPLKKNRMEEPATVYSMDNAEFYGHILPLSTLAQSCNRRVNRSWKLMLVPQETGSVQSPLTPLVSTLSACIKKHPDIRYVHALPEMVYQSPISIPDFGDFPVLTIPPEADVFTWRRLLGHFFRHDRGVLALKTLPNHIRHTALCDLTVLSGQSGGESTSWHERIGAVLRPRGEGTLGLVAVAFAGGIALETTNADTDSALTPLRLAIQTLRDLDTDFDQTITKARLERGKTGSWNLEPFAKWIEFPDGTSVDESRQRVLLEKILASVTSPWQQGLGELMAYREQWGHSDIPAGYTDNPALASWVDGQRKAFARGVLTVEQIAILDQLEFIWDPRKAAWDHMIGTLSAFRARFGHCNVEHPYPEDGSLSQWVLRQRRDRLQQRLEPHQIQRLDSLDFIWDWDAWDWERNHEKLLKLKAIHGQAWVTDPYPADPDLGNWAARQRQLQEKLKLDETRRLRLDDAGFVWDLEAAEWDHMFQRLLEFRHLHGQARLEEGDDRHPQLAQWARQQRDLYTKGQLVPERLEKLDGVGFVWDLPAAHWLDHFHSLKKFKLRHGHLQISEDDPEVGHLNLWIEEQRQLRAKNRLHPARINRLNALGLVWSAKQQQWEIVFNRFLHFKTCHLHGNVPDRLPNDPELCGWAQDQRREWRRGSIDADRRTRLTIAGFVWDPQALHWEKMLTAFARFTRHHGDADPGSVDPALAPLSDWMTSQRRMKASGRLGEAEIRKLDGLNFIWDTNAKFQADMQIALKRFMDHHGHSNIPPDFDNPPALSSWVRKVRTAKATGSLAKELEENLEKLGFVWDTREATWQEMVAALEKFVRDRNHCIVPDKFTENPKLSQWITGIRKQYKNNTLEQEKVDRLDRLGFIWDAKAIFWEEMFVTLTEYHDRFGHCLVSESDPNYPQLAWWIAAQRKARAGGQLEEGRIQRLDRLHFVWDAHAAHWLEMYRELFYFHQRHGHCLVKSDSPANVHLNDWCATQRKTWLMGQMSEEKQARLDALGFIWDQRDVIVEEMLQNLADYKKRFGHCNVPVQWPENPQLGLWVQFQRQSYKKGSLDLQRKTRLETLGMDWESVDAVVSE